jgi:uncharacterized membrane protein
MPEGQHHEEQPEEVSSRESQPSDTNRLLAGLCHVSQIVLPAVLPVILLVFEETKENAFLRHHAIHSLGLLLASVVYYAAAAIVYVAGSAAVPCVTCVLWGIFLLPPAILIYYGVLAFQGKEIEVLWLTEFLHRNEWL